MARDATLRLYDVDKDSVVLTREEGRESYAIGKITFSAKKGKLVDLDKLHESIWATRLSGRTQMRLNWLEVTAVGEAAAAEGNVVLKVAGSKEYFLLAEDPEAKPEGAAKPPLARLKDALDRGEKVVQVTGRVDGWSGHFPKFLAELPPKPRRLLVKDFQTAKQ